MKGFDLFLLIDESGSMSAEKGTDKNGLRHEAGKYLSQNLLVKDSDPKYPNRISVIHFGDNTISSELIDLIPRNSGKITEAVNFNQPKHLGDTSFINALKAVEAIHSKSPVYKNIRSKFIVVFTDGKLDDSRKLKLPLYFEELKKFSRENLKGFNIVIVGIDNSALGDHWSQSKSHWEDIIGSANLYSIIDMRDLYTKFNEIVRSIYEIPGQTDVVIDEKSFEVTPYLEKIEFHVFLYIPVKLTSDSGK